MTGVIVATPSDDAATTSRGRGANPRCKAVQTEIVCRAHNFLTLNNNVEGKEQQQTIN